MTIQPLDSNNNPIPALRLKDNGAHNIIASASSVRNSTGFDATTKIVSVYATVPVFLKMGDANITASTSDHYFPAGVYYDFAIDANAAAHNAYIAVIRADSDDGTVYISEKE